MNVLNVLMVCTSRRGGFETRPYKNMHKKVSS
jgi:hypothetical protein